MTEAIADNARTAPLKLDKDDHSEGMAYLESVPRRIVTLYIPLFIIVVILRSRSTGWRSPRSNRMNS